jgi:hypothetical protein
MTRTPPHCPLRIHLVGRFRKRHRQSLRLRLRATLPPHHRCSRHRRCRSHHEARRARVRAMLPSHRFRYRNRLRREDVVEGSEVVVVIVLLATPGRRCDPNADECTNELRECGVVGRSIMTSVDDECDLYSTSWWR